MDTNILVYAHDRSLGKKSARASSLVQEVWLAEQGVLSTQVLQELYWALRRRVSHPLSVSEADLVVRDFSTWEIVVNNLDSILRAISLEARYQISFWDGLIIQAADRAGAEILYTEDLNHGQRYGSVRAINPFLTEPLPS